jgi:hypothetical protein
MPVGCRRDLLVVTVLSCERYMLYNYPNSAQVELEWGLIVAEVGTDGGGVGTRRNAVCAEVQPDVHTLLQKQLHVAVVSRAVWRPFRTPPRSPPRGITNSTQTACRDPEGRLAPSGTHLCLTQASKRLGA